MVIIQQKALDIIILSAAMLKSFALDIFKKSNSQSWVRHPTLSYIVWRKN